MRIKLVTISLISLLLAGCATSSENIEASYVSPLKFKNLRCHQISKEMRRISKRTSKLAGVVDKNADDDAVVTAVALIIFSPAVVLLKGNGPETAEYAKLKGEFEALEETAKKKRCKIQVKKKVAKKTS